ncbi:CsgG/HfaB family protein [Tunturiibacter lichenicola]|uniref:CsgG/HfaB family protein n=1 Tax=Tunturiibacter lichenicola TaxID=2051959 RepID=UPI003D9BE82C
MNRRGASSTFRLPSKNVRTLLVLTLMGVCAVTSMVAQQRRRIAVMSLDVSPDAKQKAASQFGMQNDLGATLSDLIINRLVADGKFIVIERAALDKIIKEQNFSNSDRADPSTAVKLGKIAGVDAIVIGSITQFGGESSKKATNIPIRIHGLNVPLANSQKTSTVTVGVTARMIDTSSGSILASATGSGTSSKTTTDSNTGGATSTTSASDFATPAINDATTQAVTQVVTQIEAAPLPTVAAAPPPPPTPVVPRTSYTGTVADVSGTTLILTVGTTGGVKVGDTVVITRPTRKIKDPKTGAVIKVLSDKLGEAKITEADNKTATATYSGTAVIKVSDDISFQP